MPLDLCKTPWNVQKICEEATMKELNADLQRAVRQGASVPREYRLQAPGEEVELTGMRRHDALNGRAGEVLSRVADDQGFLLVRVQLPEGAKNMKIQPRCLKPIRHPKDGRPRGGRLTGFVDMYHDHPEAAASVVSSRPPTARSALSAAASSVLRQNPAEETSRLV
ncbi:unnamed protein product [Effrenium voratum]|uniref:Uncharacterized protein n=1 Tax=Effrenium voratum TaxID=2562239 RepID=A0AA36MRT0_9DINO|nr:unnamed protein product [Effrenium voratum]